ncbi:MAG: tetratricopeptide repeat protein [Lachnospiraceae bacterium]|nr:tetratricopeptide repeat protein [Lachnospiraceae bacterium]
MTGNNFKVSTGKTVNLLAIFAAMLVVIIVTVVVIVVVLPMGDSSHKLEKQLELGSKYYKSFEYDKAEKAYLKAIEIEPECEEAYYALMDIYFVNNNLDKAEEVLEQAEDELGKRAVRDKRAEFEELKDFINNNSNNKDAETSDGEEIDFGIIDGITGSGEEFEFEIEIPMGDAMPESGEMNGYIVEYEINGEKHTVYYAE